MIDVAAVLARPNEHPPEISPQRPMICRPECPRKPGDSPRVCMRVLWGQSLGIYSFFAMDLLAECHERRVASQARSTALKVRFIVGDREFTKGFLCQIHHLHPLFLHNACSVARRNDLC